MSVCICPDVPKDKQQELVRNFLKGLADDGKLATSNWSLMSLKDLVDVGNTLEDIPFRGGECSYTRKCCGTCTRKCYRRCIQDCLHRLWIWNQMVQSTPAEERDRIPLAIRLIVNQRFDNHRHLSWCVGEILNQSSNPAMKAYIKQTGERLGVNDYSPAVIIDPSTGRRMVDKTTGEIKLVDWPESGLCPYCLPRVTVDARFLRRR